MAKKDKRKPSTSTSASVSASQSPPRWLVYLRYSATAILAPAILVALVAPYLRVPAKTGDPGVYYMHIPKIAGTGIGYALLEHSHYKSPCRGINRPGMHMQHGFVMDNYCLQNVSRWMQGHPCTGAYCRPDQGHEGHSWMRTLPNTGTFKWSTGAFKECDALWASHYGWNIAKLARDLSPRPLKLITFVRDPVSQFYSWWYFMRYCAAYPRQITSQPSYKLHPRFAMIRATLPALAESDLVHCESRAPDASVASPGCLSARFRALFYFSGHSNTCGDYLPGSSTPMADIYEQARTNAKAFDFIGVYEELAGSMRLLASVLGLDGLDQPKKQSNVCSGYELLEQDKRTPELDERLRQLLAFDLRLYEEQKVQFAEKLAALGN